MLVDAPERRSLLHLAALRKARGCLLVEKGARIYTVPNLGHAPVWCAISVRSVETQRRNSNSSDGDSTCDCGFMDEDAWFGLFKKRSSDGTLQEPLIYRLLNRQSHSEKWVVF